jgi:hypothetical protein
MSTKGDGFLVGYWNYEPGDAGAGSISAIDGRVASFAFDGTPKAAPTQLFRGHDVSLIVGGLARTRAADLSVTYFHDCGPEMTSAICEPGAFVIARVGPDGSLQKVASVPAQSASDSVGDVNLASDGLGHNWLLWSEGAMENNGPPVGPAYIFAVPLTDEGAPSGPIESWDTWSGYPSALRTQTTVGPVGAIVPMSTGVQTDGGAYRREVRLLHRQLEAQAPIEDLTFTTTATQFGANAVQIAEPRSVIVGFNDYPPDAGYDQEGYGALARFRCAEDSP